jgi:streptomycin 6-kinase
MLGFDRQRMLRWCMAQAVLSAWWSYEDHHQVETEMILFAEALSEMIGYK